MKRPATKSGIWPACRRLVTCLCLLLSLGGCTKTADTEIIRAISMLPRQTDYTRDFENWIKQVNEEANGKFRIIFVGGPEAIPTFEQADALRTGVVHMVFGPATYYIGMVPEVEALFASNMTPMETRRNGGLELMDRIHREKLAARYLARAMFIEFHIFTRERPVIDEHGIPDLSRLLVRGGPVWRSFITGLGADFANVAAPDVYMALERNMLQGIGWPIVGLVDASWDQHLRYRIDPGVFSSDVGIIFNAARWDTLPQPVRTQLREMTGRYEEESYQRFVQLTRELDRKMRGRGMEVVTLDEAGSRNYRQLASAVIWRRVRERSPVYFADLRKRFFNEGAGKRK